MALRAFTKQEIINTPCCKFVWDFIYQRGGVLAHLNVRYQELKKDFSNAKDQSLYLRMEMTVTLSNIHEKACEFWELAHEAQVIAFHGQMGSGKTTFIHALCDEKKVKSSVSSPTFSIINEYEYPLGTIYHIDLYRLNDEDEAIRAGVEDCLYSGYICLVEWPEKAPSIFPESTLHVHFDFVDSQTRRLRLDDK